MWVNICGVLLIFMLFHFFCAVVKMQEERDYYLVTICWYVFSCDKENPNFVVYAILHPQYYHCVS